MSRVCAVPGCDASLYFGNLSGVCRVHNHAVGYCQCKECTGVAPVRPKPQARGRPRKGAAAHAFGMAVHSAAREQQRHKAPDRWQGREPEEMTISELCAPVSAQEMPRASRWSDAHARERG